MNEKIEQAKPSVVLLGDGFLARGFLRYIDRKKFHITQIYKDPFINPQDVIYAFHQGSRFNPDEPRWRFQSVRPADVKIQTEIKKLNLQDGTVKINDINYPFDHLVIGLGAQKSVRSWVEDINALVGLKGSAIGIIGMGPIGVELGTILARQNKVTMYDMLAKEQTIQYVKSRSRSFVENFIREKGITVNYAQAFTPSGGSGDKTIFCVGNRPHPLSAGIPIDSCLRSQHWRNVYVGGDGASMPGLKTAQVAYQQGAYIAESLNRTESLNRIEDENEPFQFVQKGLALNLDGKVLIEGHALVPDGVYPAFVTRLYSMFFV
jgi:NADH dehydrogenase FAD-containing subunit